MLQLPSWTPLQSEMQTPTRPFSGSTLGSIHSLRSLPDIAEDVEEAEDVPGCYATEGQAPVQIVLVASDKFPSNLHMKSIPRYAERVR